jgi:hypothetical protein
MPGMWTVARDARAASSCTSTFTHSKVPAGTVNVSRATGTTFTGYTPSAPANTLNSSGCPTSRGSRRSTNGISESSNAASSRSYARGVARRPVTSTRPSANRATVSVARPVRCIWKDDGKSVSASTSMRRDVPTAATPPSVVV